MSAVDDSDRRLASACLLGSFDGTEVPAWLLDRVRNGLGGVLLFAQNVAGDEQVAASCEQLRCARSDVLIAIDEEGGDVTRLDAAWGSDVPTPAAFGAVDDVALTHAAYAALGRRVRSLGIDLTLAPCADINSNPLNPIIGLRSFGTEPHHVASHVTAAITGFRAGGIAVCAKHYPGHGDTSADTHLGAARISVPMAALAERELVPFAAAIDAGTDAVLTAHIVVDAFDTEPVSISRRWTGHLRTESGFSGTIVTDALDMDAVAMGRGIDGVADAAVRALAAGADLLCLGSNFDAAMTDQVIDVVTAALVDGRLDRASLWRSVERIVTLRRPVADAVREIGEIDGADGERSPSAASMVAARAVSVDGVLPTGPFVVLECRPQLSSACFNVTWGVAAALGDLGWPTHTITEHDAIAVACAPVLREAAFGSMPVLVVVRDAGVHPWQADVIVHIARSLDVPIVVVEMGWPGAPPSDAGQVVSVVTYGAARCSATALVELVTATSRLSGTQRMEES